MTRVTGIDPFTRRLVLCDITVPDGNGYIGVTLKEFGADKLLEDEVRTLWPQLTDEERDMIVNTDQFRFDPIVRQESVPCPISPAILAQLQA